MATYQEQLEKARKVREANQQLVIATLMEDKDKIADLNFVLWKNLPEDISRRNVRPRSAVNAAFPWMKV